MSTINQIAKNKRLQKIKWKSNVKLDHCPLKLGIVSVVYTDSPKKPNSGKRKLAKVLLSNNRRAIVTIPDGQAGGVTLQKYSRVLIRGGRTQDMPGAHYKIIRTSKGRIGQTMAGSINRVQKRSKYGSVKPYR